MPAQSKLSAMRLTSPVARAARRSAASCRGVVAQPRPGGRRSGARGAAASSPSSSIGLPLRTILGHKLKSIEVIREYDPNLPRLTAHGSQLNQVWTNLIDNAIDALHGQGHIWLRTSLEGDHILVEIADDGPGISPEIQSRIFEPFFTTKGIGDGTGMGLEIAYRIVVEDHRGDLQVNSQPGDTRFCVFLPLHHTED